MALNQLTVIRLRRRQYVAVLLLDVLHFLLNNVNEAANLLHLVVTYKGVIWG